MKPTFALRQKKVAFLVQHRQLWYHPTEAPAAFQEKLNERVARLMQASGLFSPATKLSDIVQGLPRLLAQAKAQINGEARDEVLDSPRACCHGNWAVRSYTVPGYGICLDCHQEIPLPALIDALRRRVQETFGPNV